MARMSRPLITLTTDFGVGSPYIAQMKGVLLSRCREVEIVDITHAIQPQNVREGAIVLADAAPFFPTGTLHIAVVDPGVGTSRRLVYAEIEGRGYLAPDNGLLSRLALATPPSRLIALENRQYWREHVTSTFHGRDILAPAAAYLAHGVDPGELGPPLEHLAPFDWPAPKRSADQLAGEVLYVDSFGNLISNIAAADLSSIGSLSERIVECAGRRIAGIQTTYGQSRTGEIVALVDSHGRLEIAAVNENASQRLAAGEGTPIVIY